MTTNYYLGLQLIAQRKGTDLQYIHQDHLGGTSVISDSGGNQISATSYLPFGTTRTGSVPTDIKFTGQRLDDSGLYYYGARYYDPIIGRFISADTYVQWLDGFNLVSNQLTTNMITQCSQPELTIQAPVTSQALNRYSYVLNNPLRYNDPYGWWTGGIGISLSLAAGVAGVFSVMFVIDGTGGMAIALTWGVGEGSPNAEVAIQVQGTTAAKVSDLGDTSSETGASSTFMNAVIARAGLTGGGEAILSSDYDGGNAKLGLAVGAFPVEQHSTINHTEVFELLPSSNPYGDSSDYVTISYDPLDTLPDVDVPDSTIESNDDLGLESVDVSVEMCGEGGYD